MYLWWRLIRSALPAGRGEKKFGSMDVAQLPEINGYTTGTWKIDPSHSEVSFVLRHTMVQIRGRFSVNGTIVTEDDLAKSHVDVTIDPATFYSGSPVRDEKIRYFTDFLDSRAFPEITFKSGEIVPVDDRRFQLHGKLTARGIERSVVLDAIFNGFGRCDLYGLRMGFLATTTLDRRDFGIATSPPVVDTTVPFEDNPTMLGWTMKVEIHVEAVLAGDEGRYRWE